MGNDFWSLDLLLYAVMWHTWASQDGMTWCRKIDNMLIGTVLFILFLSGNNILNEILSLWNSDPSLQILRTLLLSVSFRITKSCHYSPSPWTTPWYLSHASLAKLITLTILNLTSKSTEYWLTEIHNSGQRKEIWILEFF